MDQELDQEPVLLQDHSLLGLMISVLDVLKETLILEKLETDYGLSRGKQLIVLLEVNLLIIFSKGQTNITLNFKPEEPGFHLLVFNLLIVVTQRSIQE